MLKENAHPGADLHVTAPDEESVQGAVGSVELRHVRKVVQDNQHLIQFLHLQLLGRLRDLALLLDDAPQCRLVPILPVRLLPFGIHPQVLLDVLLDGNPAVIDADGRAKDVDPFEDAPVLLQNQADQSHGFPRFGRSEENARARNQWHHGVRGLFAAVFWRGEKRAQGSGLYAAGLGPWHGMEQTEHRCVSNRHVRFRHHVTPVV